MKSKISSYLIVDVETGGLISKTKEAVWDIAITEVALVLVDEDLNIVAKDTFFIREYDAEYTTTALDVSNVTKDMLNDEGIPVTKAAMRIVDFLNKYNPSSKKPVLVGQNIRNFDIFFFENLFEIGQLDLYKYTNKVIFDTLEFGWICYPDAPNYKLGTLITQFDIELESAHRALPDTVATAELWIAFLKLLRGNGSNGEDGEEEQKLISKFHF